MKGYTPLSNADLRSAARFRYPVFAVGYNWLKTNGESANHLADRIRWITSYCEAQGMKCPHGVIVVTHSMGGLVARMCAKRNESLILGVVHSVQPAIGAATAYRRVRAGWEDIAGAIAMGGTGKKIMPVFANAAGPLELLPNKRYGAGWLKVSCEGKELFSLPIAGPQGADPYSQIYLRHDKWWRLMDPAYIAPIEVETSPQERARLTNVAWAGYEETLSQAKLFHDELGDYYHAQTYVHYGADADHKSYRGIHWSIGRGARASTTVLGRMIPVPVPSKDHALNLRITFDNYEGRVMMVNDRTEKVWLNDNGKGIEHDTCGDTYMADLQDQDEAGDGTVPEHSARAAAERAIFSARMTGYDHQGSYKDRNVQNVTLFAVLRLGAGAGK